MVDALKRYHEYADQEIAKGLAELDAYNKAIADKKAELHVDEAVGDARESEAQINAAQAKQGLPQDIWDKIQAAQSTSISDLESKVNEMKEMSKSVGECLTKLLADAQQEQMEEECYRRSYPQAPIPMDVMAVLKNAQTYMGTLQQAASGEAKVAEAMQNVEAYKAFLQGTRESIEAQLPTGEVSGATASVIEDLRSVNQEVSNIVTDREAKVNDIMNMAKDDTAVRDELIRDKSADPQGVFVRGFAPIADKLRELKLSMDCQEGYLTKLESRFAAFNEAVQNDPVVIERKKVFEGISSALNSYKDAERFITEGLTFYKRLDEIVRGLRANFDTDVEKARASRGGFQPSLPTPPQQPYQPQQSQGYQPNYPPQPSQMYVPYGQQPPSYAPYGQQPYAPYGQSSTYQPYGGNAGYAPYGTPQGYPQNYDSYSQNGSVTCKSCGSLNQRSSKNCITCGKLL